MPLKRECPLVINVPTGGGEKAHSLCKSLDSYIAHGGKRNELFTLALNVLDKYLKDPFASSDNKTRAAIIRLTNTNKDLKGVIDAGTKKVSLPPSFDEGSIRNFFTSRISIRSFSHAAITKEEIKTALDFASCTPTACNRQTSKVYAFRDRRKIQEILDLQLGDQGWCNNADTLFVITGIATYFGGIYERHQVYIDGGLFAMNFVYGLHIQHIASCFKMYVRAPKTMNEFRDVCNIPQNELPIVLVLAGHYPDKESESPLSHRFSVPCSLDGVNIS